MDSSLNSIQTLDPSDVVWAKMRLCCFRPAIMVKDPPEEVKVKGGPGQICVLFFGTKKHGYVNADMIKSYSEFREKYSANRARGLANAVAKCDEFLKDPENFAHNVHVDLTKGTISIQTPLPFEIKKEPDSEDDFYQEEEVKINTKMVDKPKHSEELINETEFQQDLKGKFEKQIRDLEKHIRDNSKQIEQNTTMLKSSIKSMTERYDKELHDLKQQFNNKSLLVKNDVVKSFATEEMVTDYQIKIRDMEDQLRRKNTECLTQMAVAEEKCKQMSSQHESFLKTMSDQHDKDINDLNSKLSEKDSLYEALLLLLAKHNTEKENQQDLIEKYVSEISDLNKKLNDLSNQHEELAVAKQMVEEEFKKKSSQYESQLKTISDQHAIEINDLNNKLAKQITGVKNEQSLANSHDKLTVKRTVKKETPRKKNLKRDSETKNSAVKRHKPSTTTTSKTEPDEVHFEVERFLAHKTINNVRFFLVRWKGYKGKDDSWLPEGDLSCPNILKEYQKTNKLH